MQQKLITRLVWVKIYSSAWSFHAPFPFPFFNYVLALLISVMKGPPTINSMMQNSKTPRECPKSDADTETLISDLIAKRSTWSYLLVLAEEMIHFLMDKLTLNLKTFSFQGN